MTAIHSFINSEKNKKQFTLSALALLTASAVLRKEKSLREILSLLREKKFNKDKIYEALLQTYLFAGYPSALISLSVFSEYFNNNHRLAEDWNVKDFKIRGELNCRKIYGGKYEKLINNIGLFSPDMSDWLVTEGYGKVMGRKGLSLREREVCNIAVLTALKYESQLYSHINGGHRIGLTWNEIEKVIESVSLLNKKDCVRFGKRVLGTVIGRKRESEG